VDLAVLGHHAFDHLLDAVVVRHITNHRETFAARFLTELLCVVDRAGQTRIGFLLRARRDHHLRALARIADRHIFSEPAPRARYDRDFACKTSSHLISLPKYYRTNVWLRDASLARALPQSPHRRR